MDRDELLAKAAWLINASPSVQFDWMFANIDDLFMWRFSRVDGQSHICTRFSKGWETFCEQQGLGFLRRPGSLPDHIDPYSWKCPLCLKVGRDILHSLSGRLDRISGTGVERVVLELYADDQIWK